MRLSNARVILAQKWEVTDVSKVYHVRQGTKNVTTEAMSKWEYCFVTLICTQIKLTSVSTAQIHRTK